VGASRAAAGIVVSRVFGFGREAVFAHHFGNGALADAWRAALRIPNLIQNLLGEGTLGASFVPVYARLVEEGREEEAGRVAGAVLGLLIVVAGALAVAGIWAAPHLAAVLATGFVGDDRVDILAGLLRILFPATGVLALSAWALALLNSHRHLFVAYVAPALWNVAMIAALVAAATAGLMGVDLLRALAWGALAGGALQLCFQLAFLRGVLGAVALSLDYRMRGVREVVGKVFPVIGARGAVNISALVDTNLASRLSTGSVGVLGYAQTLYLLPISVFSLSVAAAELPELARDRVAGRDAVRKRTERAASTVLFWLIPAAIGYIVFREEAMAVYRTGGAFGETDAAVAGLVLAAYALGIPASGTSRVLSSAYFALGDTRTPARIAYGRIALSIAASVSLMFSLDRHTIGDLGLGATGLAIGASIGAWAELALLKKGLAQHLGNVALGGAHTSRYLASAVLATGVGLAIRWALASAPPLVAAAGSIGSVAVAYLWITHLWGVSPPALADRFRRWRRR